MGVTLERVQNKFACIIGELCNEPAVLSQFAVWVDLRIAEYKAKGAISLDCTGSTPDPIWLHGLKPPKSDQSVSSLDHVSAESSSRNFQRSEPSSNFLSHNNDNFEVVEIKEESPDIFPTPTLVPSERLVGTAGSFSRKRSASDIETQDFLNSDNSIFSSPLKSRRLSTSKCIADVTTKTETEDSVSNQSLMSVIGIQDEPEELHVASSNSGHIHTSHSEYEYAKGNPPENTDDDSVQIDTSVGLVGSEKRKKYAKYCIAEKKKILAEAELYGYRAVSAKLQIPQSTISTWKKAMTEDRLDIPDSKRHRYRRSGGGRPKTYSTETDEKILAWVLQQRDLHIPISQAALTAYARENITKENPDFKASSGWLTRFLRRNNLSTRMKTSLFQKFPADLMRRVVGFRQHLKEIREDMECDPAMIISMDEVPMFFDLVPRYTVHPAGQKDAREITTGVEKCHFTVVLGVTATGIKLPPMLIFKGQTPLDLSMPDGWLVRTNPTGWMTEELMEDWLTLILEPHTGRRPSLLVMDSFSLHLSANVEAVCSKIGCRTAIIPGGCAAHVQPLDVALSRPFKHHLRSLCADKTSAKGNEVTQAPKTSKQDIIHWVAIAWESLSADLVEKSFKVTGISNALDGHEESDIGNRSLIAQYLGPLEEEDEEFVGFLPEDMFEPEDSFLGVSAD